MQIKKKKYFLVSYIYNIKDCCTFRFEIGKEITINLMWETGSLICILYW